MVLHSLCECDLKPLVWVVPFFAFYNVSVTTNVHMTIILMSIMFDSCNFEANVEVPRCTRTSK
jgi:hypothetical protein